MCTLIIMDEEKNSQRRITRILCRGRYKENAISISTSIYLTNKEVLDNTDTHLNEIRQGID